MWASLLALAKSIYYFHVLLRVYENTKIKGLDLGKITSLPKSPTRTWSTTRFTTSIISKNWTACSSMLGDPGAVNRDDTMFVVKVYCLDLTINFHHEYCIVSTNCPWVSEDACSSRVSFNTHHEWKSSRFLFPVSTVAARNAWEPNLPFVS